MSAPFFIKQIIRAYQGSFTGLSHESWLLSTVILINRSTYMALPFMSLYITQFLHSSAADAGIILSLFGAGAILGTVTGGKLTDAFGFRTVQIFSIITAGLFFIGFSTISHFETLCIITVVIGFFAEAFKPANFTAIAAYAAPHTETRSYSLNRLASNIGWATGSSLGGIVASLNYRLLFIVDGSVSILAGILIWILLPKVKHNLKSVGSKRATGNGLKPWNDPFYMRFIFTTTIFSICFYLMFRVAPLFFKEVWHMDESFIGMILGLNGLLIALFEMVLINHIEELHPPLYYILIGVLFTTSSYAILLLPGFAPIAIGVVSIILLTIGEMLAMPFINSVVISRSNPFNRGQYAAAYTMSGSIAQVIGPTAGFYLAEKCGYSMLWVILMILLMLSAFSYRLLRLHQTAN